MYVIDSLQRALNLYTNTNKKEKKNAETLLCHVENISIWLVILFPAVLQQQWSIVRHGGL